MRVRTVTYCIVSHNNQTGILSATVAHTHQNDNSPQKSFGDKVHPPPEGTRCFFDPTTNKPVMIVGGIAKEPDMVCDDDGFVSGILYMAEGQWINWTSEVTMDTWAELETVTTPNPKKRKVMQRPAGSVCAKSLQAKPVGVLKKSSNWQLLQTRHRKHSV